MPCTNCGSDRMVAVNAKCSDCFFGTFKDYNYDGYPPTGVGLGDDSKCLEFEYCLDCGKIEGEFPIKEDPPDIEPEAWRKRREEEGFGLRI